MKNQRIRGCNQGRDEGERGFFQVLKKDWKMEWRVIQRVFSSPSIFKNLGFGLLFCIGNMLKNQIGRMFWNSWRPVNKRKKTTFPPPIFTKIHFSSLNSKIGKTTSLSFSNRAFYLTRAVLKAVLL
jgi:hypothetical protein